MADKPFVSPRRLKKFLTNLLGEKLNTKEEILANTDVKKFAGAMAVQEIYEDVTNSLGNLSFYEDEDGNKYVVGADSVPKKLGRSEVTVVVTTSGTGSNGGTKITLTLTGSDGTVIFTDTATNYGAGKKIMYVME